MKKLLAIAFSTVSILHATEIIAPSSPDQWQRIGGRYSMEVVEDGGVPVFSVRGPADIRSQMMLTIDPRKTYKLSGEFRAADGTVPTKIYFGVMELDVNGRLVSSNDVFAIKDSDTVLSADAKAGDTVIQVRDASKWQQNVSSSAAFNIAADLSDLPNRDISPAIKSITRNADFFTLHLSAPLRKNYAAGTPVRQHRHAGSYHYTHGNKQLTHQWQSFSIIIHGQVTYGVPTHRWWRGAQRAGLLVLVNHGGNADSVTLMRNVKIEELTR